MDSKTVNITLKIDAYNLNNFENWLRNQLEVIDFKILPDTEKLYQEDKHFKKLVDSERLAKKAKAEYINKHNH